MRGKTRINTSALTSLVAFTMLTLYACSSPTEKGQTEAPREKEQTDINAEMISSGYELYESDTMLIDSKAFVVATYKVANEDVLLGSSPDQVMRPLLVLSKANAGHYELMVRNDSLVLCGSCGGINGDPFESIEPEEAGFTIYHSGGSSDRWTRNITFQFDPTQKAWLLIADQGANFSTLDPENSFEEVTYTPTDSIGKTRLQQFNTYNSF